MNCSEYKDKLFAYVDGVLEDSQRKAVRLHLEACADCSEEVREIQRLHEELTAEGIACAGSDLENAVLGRIVREQTFKLRKTEGASYGIGEWRNIMNSKMTKYAAAAVLIIAGLVGLGIINHHGGGSVVWAEVLERVVKVKAFVYRIHMDISSMKGIPAGTKMEIEAKVSGDDGMMLNTYMDGKLISRTFAQLEDQAMVTLMPEQKKYMRILFTEESFEKMREENHDPKKILEGFLTGEYTELGRSEINGITVEGVESRDSNLARGMLGNAVGQLWVDVETGWPVQITIDILNEAGDSQMVMVMDGFQWDVEVEASEFAGEIPDDYELLGQVDLGQLENGDQITEGLAFFAEITEGRYPSELTLMTVSEELSKAIKSKADGGNQEPSKEDLQHMMSLQVAAAFYSGLANEGKEPMYYGATVTAADADKVLLRWKQDDGNYRVILGDLRIEDVGAARLAELEAE